MRGHELYKYSVAIMLITPIFVGRPSESLKSMIAIRKLVCVPPLHRSPVHFNSLDPIRSRADISWSSSIGSSCSIKLISCQAFMGKLL
jgi:hypothetical protein